MQGPTGLSPQSNKARWLLALSLCAAAVLACARPEAQVYGTALRIGEPDLFEIYGRSAEFVTPGRNPVVIIHGVLGAKLADRQTGELVWGKFTLGNFAPASGNRLALPMREGATLAELSDQLDPVGVLDRVRVQFLPGPPLAYEAYGSILETLGAAGYKPPGFSLIGTGKTINHQRSFQFAYDWRRDNVENARRLYTFLIERRQQIQAEIQLLWGIEDYPVRFDIVAHSMGGLVTRYMLRYGDADLPADGSLPELTWKGAPLVERAVLVGTPNAGLVDAFRHLVEGAAFSGMPAYPPAVVGTMPSIYQLMPRTRHHVAMNIDDPRQPIGDIYDPALWQRFGWGLAAPAQQTILARLLPDLPSAEDRQRVALEHLAKCLARAKQFHEAIDLPAHEPGSTRLYLFAGDAVETNQSVSVDPRTGRIAVLQTNAGDRVVLRSSALMDERLGHPARWTTPRLVSPIHWRAVYFLRDDHMSITRSADFSNNLLFLLLQEPPN